VVDDPILSEGTFNIDPPGWRVDDVTTLRKNANGWQLWITIGESF
jgi:hypothetical protein